jgi:phenylalanyl-tRNA synthetase alpha chain
MQDRIDQLTTDIQESLTKCTSIGDLEDVRLTFLSKKGSVSLLLKELGKCSIEDKKTYGKVINELKTTLNSQISTKKSDLESIQLEANLIKEKCDITLPSRGKNKGTTHPINIITNEIADIFLELGYDVAEGPEIESDYYNFEALNFPEDHPARDMHDTFYIQNFPDYLLRTHTSGVQVHYMEKHTPPIRVIAPGKVFRSDADVSHSPVFHQIEGLYIDKNISMSHLKATLERLMEKIFEKKKKIRLRPSYFPFTEPSVEMDVECVLCGGSGCGVCKKTGWIEILGAGMVDPAVLKSGGIDSDHYSGFAFGLGIERIAMLKYGINNIKLFFDSHQRFVRQF